MKILGSKILGSKILGSKILGSKILGSKIQCSGQRPAARVSAVLAIAVPIAVVVCRWPSAATDSASLIEFEAAL